MTQARRAVSLVAAAFMLLAPPMAAAQDSKSAALASELVRLLDQVKLDSMAAKVSAPDRYAAALYLPGSQILVISAQYAAPQRMDVSITEKKYRDVYIDLNSASVPKSRIFISDLGADGLRARRSGDKSFDTVDMNGKSYSFDGDWDKAKISEDEYMKTFQATESEYIKMLEALVAQLKKTS